MENLIPAEIKLDIFSRLPAVSVLQCRKVCKTWRTLLQHPDFAAMHLSRSPQLGKLSLLYFHGKYNGHQKQLYYGEHDESELDEEKTHKRVKRINHPPVNIGDRVVGSCNGLICFSVNWYINDSIYICNPITREYANLPEYNNNVSPRRFLTAPHVYGFGYIPSTNEYKVLRISVCSDPYQSKPSEWVRSVQVYTLGGGSGWRNKGEIMFSPAGHSVFANGTLYWLDEEEKKTVAFDLADEQFHFLPLPPLAETRDISIFYPRALGGLLTVVHRNFDESLDIWSLKKNCTYDMKGQEHQTWSWDREYIISYECLVMPSYDPFAFTKSGEILMWYDFSHRFPDDHNHIDLYSYNPKTKNVDTFVTDLKFLEAIPHVNSFISLKALGEDAKILGSAEGFTVPAMWQDIWERFKGPRVKQKMIKRGDKDEVEGGNKKRKRCKACGGLGHNRRTCTQEGVPNSS